ncbi:hypothetical protein ASF88_15915 [Leifsonia sp. Leaf336]|nr:hypothetical protein ASF88_15915 [Leifsonia sp. Leaf336]
MHGGLRAGASGSSTMSTSSSVATGGGVHSSAGDRSCPKSLPLYADGMGAPCAKARLVKANDSGARRSVRSQTTFS